MREDKIVQFVHFETTLNSDQFITKWEHFIRSVNSDVDVTIQQSENKGMFRYIAQHRCASGEFQFVFTKSGRASRIPEVEIKAKQMGGYSILHAEKMSDPGANENKIFVFLSQSQVDLKSFQQLSSHCKLNIYEAYYENCKYPYILEFYVKKQHVEELIDQLKRMDTAEIGAYKTCALQAV